MRWGEVDQSCPTLCDPVDCNLLGFSVHGILQARILEWIAISFSRGSSDPGIEPGSPTLEADALTFEPPVEKKSLPWLLRQHSWFFSHLYCYFLSVSFTSFSTWILNTFLFFPFLIHILQVWIHSMLGNQIPIKGQIFVLHFKIIYSMNHTTYL